MLDQGVGLVHKTLLERWRDNQETKATRRCFRFWEGQDAHGRPSTNSA